MVSAIERGQPVIRIISSHFWHLQTIFIFILPKIFGEIDWTFHLPISEPLHFVSWKITQCRFDSECVDNVWF